MMTHRDKHLRTITRTMLITAVSLSVCSCGKSTEAPDNSEDHSQIIQRIELLEQRMDTLLDEDARDQAKRRAEQEGFNAKKIEQN